MGKLGCLRAYFLKYAQDNFKKIKLTFSNGDVCSTCPLAISPEPVVKVMRTSYNSVLVIEIRISPGYVIVGVIIIGSRYMPFSAS